MILCEVDMDKKWIRNLPVAEKRKPTDHTMVTVEEKNETLLINVFLAGETRAAYRVAMTDDDYITRDIKNSTWKMGRIDAILGVCWYCKNHPVISSGRNIYEKRFGKITDKKRWWKEALDWQTKILDSRRQEQMMVEMNEVDILDPYYRYPKDLRKAHDKAVVDYRSWKKKEETRKEKWIAKRTKEVLEKATGSGYEMKAAGLMIVIPKSSEEIKKEGELQHHCVGTYVERVARGETMILFVRKEEAPDKPYFTMEWKKDHVAQCRGKHNADMPKEVQAFVNAFEERMKRRAV